MSSSQNQMAQLKKVLGQRIEGRINGKKTKKCRKHSVLSKMVINMLVLEMEIRKWWYSQITILPLITVHAKEGKIGSKISVIGPVRAVLIIIMRAELTAICANSVKSKVHKCCTTIPAESLHLDHNFSLRCNNSSSQFSKRNQWCLERCLSPLFLNINTDFEVLGTAFFVI